MERKKSNIKPHYLVYLAFAVFYFWMSAQIPYTHDDWDWGLDIGIQQLLTASINSRYVGNFFVVVMTRSELLKTLIMGSVSTLLPLAATAAALKGEQADGKKRLILFLFANCLLLTIDSEIWRQTYGWVSGYANYVLSAPALLLCLHICFDAMDCQPQKKGTNSVVSRIGIFLLGVAVQLFLENLALYIVLLSLATCIIEYIRTKKISPRMLCLLLGSIIGLAIMFSSNIYSTLWTEGVAVGGYRKFNLQSGAKETVMNWIYRTAVIIIMTFEYNLAISIGILVLMGLLLLRHRSRIHRVAAAVNGILCVYFLYNRICSATPNIWLETAVNGLFFLIVAGEAFLLFADDKSRLYKLLTVWISGPILLMPIVITTELGERLFLTSNILLIVFALVLLDVLLCRMSEKGCRTIAVCAMATAAAVSLFYVGIYSQIGACKIQRDAIITEAIETEATSVVLPKFPHNEYLWGADPSDDGRKAFFREFYGLAPDTEIVIGE